MARIFYDVEQAARKLGSSVQEVEALISSKELSILSIGNRRVIPARDVDNLLNRNTPRPINSSRAREVGSVSGKEHSGDKHQRTERPAEDYGRIIEAAQRLGKSINQVKQMIAEGHLSLDPNSGKLVTLAQGSDTSPDDRVARKAPAIPPGRNVKARTQNEPDTRRISELEEWIRDLQDELHAAREEKEGLVEELQQEREGHQRDLRDAQYEINQLDAALENQRRNHAEQIKALREELKKNSADKDDDKQDPKPGRGYLRRFITAQTSDAQRERELEDEVKALKVTLRTDRAYLQRELEREREGRKQDSLKAQEKLDSELESLRSALEARNRALQAELEEVRSHLEDERARRSSAEELLRLERDKRQHLESEIGILNEIRRLLGAGSTQQSEQSADGTPPALDPDGVSSKLVLKTPSGQVSLSSPFELDDKEKELLSLIAEHGELTAEQITTLTGRPRHRAVRDLEELLDRLKDEDIDIVKQSGNRYIFDPATLQDL